MIFKDYPGFTYFKLADGRFRVYWRENGHQHSKIFEKYDLAEAWVNDAYHSITGARKLHRSKHVDYGISLDAELKLYPLRLLREQTQEDSKHIPMVMRRLRKLFRVNNFVTLADITPEALDAYKLERKDFPGGFFKEICNLSTFLKRLKERGIAVPEILLSYKVPEPESDHIHIPWTLEEIKRWWSYLTDGIEVLAQADPSLSWHERILRHCHSTGYAQRMRLTSLHLPQDRYLIRPSEMRRFRCMNWDATRGIMQLSRKVAKKKPRRALVDVETAWMNSVCALNGLADRPLFQASEGGKWNDVYLSHVYRQHLDAAGLEDKKPYDVKYNTATFIFSNPHLFEDRRHREWIERVRAIAGHEDESEATERYIEALWGSEYATPVMEYYNTVRLFPFRVEDFPPLPPTHSHEYKKAE